MVSNEKKPEEIFVLTLQGNIIYGSEEGTAPRTQGNWIYYFNSQEFRRGGYRFR